MFPGLSFLHVTVVAIVALLVLGPDKLPDLARRAGGAYRELQQLRQHLHLDLSDLLSDPSDDQPPAPLNVSTAGRDRDQARVGNDLDQPGVTGRPMPRRQRAPRPAPPARHSTSATPVTQTTPPISVRAGFHRQRPPHPDTSSA